MAMLYIYIYVCKSWANRLQVDTLHGYVSHNQRVHLDIPMDIPSRKNANREARLSYCYQTASMVLLQAYHILARRQTLWRKI